ncbi:MAG: AtpZ/AtpI family protein [Candidatus Doudnabacteria bacterium]|nr:AtpZ/AtpI family protein [Candidatus Doudnabacteria bacterium]
METPAQNPKKVDRSALISLSLELGYIIAIPLVAFALGGKWLDNRMQNEFPFMTLLGIGLAITATTVWITKKVKKYIK